MLLCHLLGASRLSDAGWRRGRVLRLPSHILPANFTYFANSEKWHANVPVTEKLIEVFTLCACVKRMSRRKQAKPRSLKRKFADKTISDSDEIIKNYWDLPFVIDFKKEKDKDIARQKNAVNMPIR